MRMMTPCIGEGVRRHRRVYDQQTKVAVMRSVLASKYVRPTKECVVSHVDASEALSDNDLLRAIAEGDRSAFSILMKRYLPNMVTLAQRIVFDREQAREIVQEAFIRVWKNAAKWDPCGSATFLTWLRHITVNLSISVRRRHREQVSIDLIEELPSDFADGFVIVATSDQKRVVQKAMQKLPERQRAAVALYYFDELPQAEAAEIMEMTPRAFDSLIVRARSSLKKYFVDSGINFKEDLS